MRAQSSSQYCVLISTVLIEWLPPIPNPRAAFRVSKRGISRNIGNTIYRKNARDQGATANAILDLRVICVLDFGGGHGRQWDACLLYCVTGLM